MLKSIAFQAGNKEDLKQLILNSLDEDDKKLLVALRLKYKLSPTVGPRYTAIAYYFIKN
jgi:hypothetical protein